MTGEHGPVASYDCQKAECDFRGRRWEAWFTPEIPVSEGPWKLKGLPGLILYARDTTGQYSFEAVSVTDSHEPFYDYVYEHEDRTTYRRFKRYERSCFRWPKSFNEGTTVYIVTGKGIEEADYRNWRSRAVHLGKKTHRIQPGGTHVQPQRLVRLADLPG